MTFKPLLAATAPEDLSTLRFPLLASPKLDGIRCVKLGGKALSRTLKPIPNGFVREWVERNLPDGIDGELLLRDWTAPFADVSSAIMSRDGEPDFVFAAFDLMQHTETGPVQDESFALRLEHLRRFHEAQPLAISHRFQVVAHHGVYDLEQLQKLSELHLGQGYEGTMVRDPAGRYKFGRSTVKEGILLKIKPFEDAEATVVGVVEEAHNANEAFKDELGRTKRSSAKEGKVGKNRLGALVCRFDDGTEFECGSGLTDEDKEVLWAPFRLGVEVQRAAIGSRGPTTIIFGSEVCTLYGKRVKVKYLPPPGGRKTGEAPRHPVFLGFRNEVDA